MSLYTRMTNPEAGEVKIPIHGLCSYILEVAGGHKTAQELYDTFALTPDEQTELLWIRDKLLAVPANRRGDFMRTFRDLLYLAELGLAYTLQSEMQTRVNTLVTDLNS